MKASHAIDMVCSQDPNLGMYGREATAELSVDQERLSSPLRTECCLSTVVRGGRAGIGRA